MSGKVKKTNSVGSGVVVGAAEKHRLFKGLAGRLKSYRYFRQVATVLTVIVVVAAIVIGLLLVRNSTNQRHSEADRQANLKAVATAKPTGALDEAQALAAQGNVAGANEKLQTAIAAATSNQDKHQLLVAQAVVALNAGQDQQALDLIAEAEKYGATRSSSDVGAMAAEALHQNALAIEYYNKSLARMDKSDPQYASDKSDIEKSIEALQ